jgi:predicted CXXCH cytochrome family protein
VASVNSGVAGVNADSCAGCHRAHTAQGEFLLVGSSGTALCLTCHGAAAVGATTSVESGVQYALGIDGARNTAVTLGALRGGGFVTARIDSGDAARFRWGGTVEAAHPTVYQFSKKVGVLDAGAAVTSSHLDLDHPGATATAWGNGAFTAAIDPGPTVSLTCATCHNPHGNGQYRILNPIPDPVTGTLVEASPGAAWGIRVTDGPAVPAGDTRNYTVIQADGLGGRYLLASEIIADGVAATAGDYWHQVVPWNAQVSDSTVANHDAPNGDPSFFNGQINAWCATCHSRYTQSTNFSQTNSTPVPGSAEVAGNLRTNRVYNVDGTSTIGQPMVTPTGDSIYNYRHTTSRNRACTTCHVAHGSNAVMDNDPATAGSQGESAAVPYPGGAAAPVGDSRLLKIDNRGTCQMCHDPTMSVPVGSYTGPDPSPGLP